MIPKIAVLVAARKNSKFLAKFLFGLFQNTDDPKALDIHIMLNAGDTWNDELVSMAERGEWPAKLNFYREDYQMGRAGLHVYFNDLIKNTKADWIAYFCEDHFISRSGWDTYFRRLIAGASGQAMIERDFPLDPAEPWVVVPKFDNCGAMNHIVSRGFVEALDGKLGNHGWIDTYINDLTVRAWGKHPTRLVRMDIEAFHDFTHDHPNPMSDAHLQSVLGPEAAKLPKHDSPEYWEQVESDVTKLRGK